MNPNAKALLWLAACVGGCYIFTSTVLTIPGGKAPGIGEIGRLVVEGESEAMVAVDEPAYDRFHQLAVAHDTRGIALMALAGRLFLVPRGTEARVIGSGSGRREVRIVAGAQSGRSGWVPNGWIVPTG